MAAAQKQKRTTVAINLVRKHEVKHLKIDIFVFLYKNRNAILYFKTQIGTYFLYFHIFSGCSQKILEEKSHLVCQLYGIIGTIWISKLDLGRINPFTVNTIGARNIVIET